MYLLGKSCLCGGINAILTSFITSYVPKSINLNFWGCDLRHTLVSCMQLLQNWDWYQHKRLCRGAALAHTVDVIYRPYYNYYRNISVNVEKGNRKRKIKGSVLVKKKQKRRYLSRMKKKKEEKQCPHCIQWFAKDHTKSQPWSVFYNHVKSTSRNSWLR